LYGQVSLTVPKSAELTLRLGSSGDTDYQEAVVQQTLTITVPPGRPKKISVSVWSVFGEDSDISLTAEIGGAGTDGKKVIVSNGIPLQGIRLWNAITQGTYTRVLTWTANASYEATRAGEYSWEVVFTVADRD